MCDVISQRGHYTHQRNFFKEFACQGIWARALTLCPCLAPPEGWFGSLLPGHIHAGSVSGHSQPTHGFLTPTGFCVCRDSQAKGGKINQVND